MKLLFSVISLSVYISFGQCSDVNIIDPSFEQISPSGQVDSWLVNDGGIFTSQESHYGDSSFCTYTGGCYQYVSVEPNTDYYLSLYVKNGSLLDSYFYYQSNGQTQMVPISISTDDWAFVSHTFNTGADTSIFIGAYSNGWYTYFDDFHLTCESIANISETNASDIYSLQTISNSTFILTSKEHLNVTVFDMSGQKIEEWNQNTEKLPFGSEYSYGTYLLKIESKGKLWHEKIIKIRT